jgi:hypothetical protein
MLTLSRTAGAVSVTFVATVALTSGVQQPAQAYPFAADGGPEGIGYGTPRVGHINAAVNGPGLVGACRRPDGSIASVNQRTGNIALTAQALMWASGGYDAVVSGELAPATVGTKHMVDGNFGDQSSAATKHVQKYYGRTPDGCVGSNLWQNFAPPFMVPAGWDANFGYYQYTDQLWGRGTVQFKEARCVYVGWQGWHVMDSARTDNQCWTNHWDGHQWVWGVEYG